jgi:hypothetical protein
MHDNETQHEEVAIRTGIRAGDDGSQMGSGHTFGGGGLGSGSAAGNGQMGSGG